MKNNNGFTLTEILVVIAVITVLLGLGGSLAAKFANRRGVDRITTGISSSLQLAKLKASRQGVEHRTILSFNSPDVAIMQERGDSNSKSMNYVQESFQTIHVNPGLIVEPANITYNFTPKGFLDPMPEEEDEQFVDIRPQTPKQGDRCGSVSVGALGRIAVIQGNWNAGENICKAVK